MTATATERAMRPLLLRPHLVRATLDGIKTQTRRVVVPQPPAWVDRYDRSADPLHWLPSGVYVRDPSGVLGRGSIAARGTGMPVRCPYGQPGDRLWVRETWASIYERTDKSPGVIYLADGPEYLPATRRGHNWTREIGRGHWKPSIHMPRWACRLVLEVTDIRIERLQAISHDDALAEGIDTSDIRTSWEVRERDARIPFARGWDAINARRGYGWDADPWVWVVSYRVHRTGAGAAE